MLVGIGPEGVGSDRGGGGGEGGEDFVGAFGGDEALAVGEDVGEAVVLCLIIVEFEPPEEGARVLEEAEIEGVLGEGGREVLALFEGAGIVALPGEFFELGVGEAIFGPDEWRGFGFGFDCGLGFFWRLGRGSCGGVEAVAEVREAEEGEGVADDVRNSQIDARLAGG